MKKIARLFIAATISAALIGGEAAAAERGRKEYNNGNRQEQPRQPQQRPGNSGKKPERPGGQSRPDNSNKRPGGNTGRPDHRPGGNTGRPDHRPDHGHNRPDHGHNRPDHRPPRPQHGHAHHRPHMPGGWTHWRPAPPPPAYRPYAAWPRFSTVLGVRFGTTLALTLNSLMASGYNVVSSYNNTVYLRNVPMLGIYWPEATLCYTASGRLAGSEFVNYDSYPDPTLYNSVYNRLCANYGMPYSTSGMNASWWGPEGQYIRLNYTSGIGADGFTRYYTTLNFGIY